LYFYALLETNEAKQAQYCNHCHFTGCG
jgi:hypothetical protein